MNLKHILLLFVLRNTAVAFGSEPNGAKSFEQDVLKICNYATENYSTVQSLEHCLQNAYWHYSYDGELNLLIKIAYKDKSSIHLELLGGKVEMGYCAQCITNWKKLID